MWVSHDVSGFLNAASGVNILQTGQRAANNALSCSHNPLQLCGRTCDSFHTDVMQLVRMLCGASVGVKDEFVEAHLLQSSQEGVCTILLFSPSLHQRVLSSCFFY